jgi:AcrR family transcriptional regulator
MKPSRPLLSREFVLGHRRSRILEAVAELSAEQGYEAMTISDIVGRAGVARKTLYENYDGKEEVFLAAVDAAFDAVRECVEGACAAGDGEWSEQVDAALTALLDYLAEHPAEAQMLILETPAATPASAARYQAAVERFAGLLADATPAAPTPSETIEESLVGGVAWILNRRLRLGEAARLRELSGELSEFVLAPWAQSVR